MADKIVNHKCPQCGCGKAHIIDDCIIYDKYYICANKYCGSANFSNSKKLTQKQNDARAKAIAEGFKEFCDKQIVEFT